MHILLVFRWLGIVSVCFSSVHDIFWEREGLPRHPAIDSALLPSGGPKNVSFLGRTILVNLSLSKFRGDSCLNVVCFQPVYEGSDVF